MPYTVTFDPNSTSQQAQVIPNATPFNDGVMSKEQAAALAGVSTGAQIIIVDSSQFDGDGNYDLEFANGFAFDGDYDVLITPYTDPLNGPMTFNIVPRSGDPAPPATKSPTGFRIRASASPTGTGWRLRVRCWQ